MSANTLGNHLRYTSFGESHGRAVGLVLDGLPSGIQVSLDKWQHYLDRRRPGTLARVANSTGVSARNEPDQVQVMSGVLNGRTLGTPICAWVMNQDADSAHYQERAAEYRVRPGHALDLWEHKFGFHDLRGSGRASARETVARVLAGAIAEDLLIEIWPGFQVMGALSRIGDCTASEQDLQSLVEGTYSREDLDVRPARFLGNSERAIELLSGAQESGDSLGAEVSIVCHGVPKGIGEPIFQKIKARLAQSAMSLGTSIGFDIGFWDNSDIDVGSHYYRETGLTSRLGGSRGGITSGDPLLFRVQLKPTSTRGSLAKSGRHDVCVGIRAVPIVEAMTSFVLADLALSRVTNQVSSLSDYFAAERESL